MKADSIKMEWMNLKRIAWNDFTFIERKCKIKTTVGNVSPEETGC